MTSSTITTRPLSGAPTTTPPSPWSFASLRLKLKGRLLTLFGKRDRGRRRQGDALVGRTEDLVAGNSRRPQRLRVELTEAAQAVAVAEQPGIEEIGTVPARLGHEFPESKHVACQRKGEEFLAKVGHRGSGGGDGQREIIPVALRAPRGAPTPPRVNSRAFPPPTRTLRPPSRAHRHPERQRHPLGRPQGSRALAHPRQALGRRLPAGDQGRRRRRAGFAARSARRARPRSTRRRRRATPASRCTRGIRRACAPASATRNSTPRGATSRPTSAISS